MNELEEEIKEEIKILEKKENKARKILKDIKKLISELEYPGTMIEAELLIKEIKEIYNRH